MRGELARSWRRDNVTEGKAWEAFGTNDQELRDGQSDRACFGRMSEEREGAGIPARELLAGSRGRGLGRDRVNAPGPSESERKEAELERSLRRQH